MTPPLDAGLQWWRWEPYPTPRMSRRAMGGYCRVHARQHGWCEACPACAWRAPQPQRTPVQMELAL